MAGDCLKTDSNDLPTAAPDLWRTAEELANGPEFREMLSREFPDDVDTWTDPVSRRRFITLMGASLALAGANGCSPRPASPHKIFPYTKQPEGITLGVPNFYPSAFVLGGVGTGIVVKSHEGRPTKIEGNPHHPGSLGGTDIFAQASILEMFDPDRSQALTNVDGSRTWEETVAAFRIELAKLKEKKAGIRILTETITSPTLADQIDKLVKKYDAKWVQFEPLARDQVRAGNKQAFGEDVDVIYDFREANVVVALDADFLTVGPGAVRYARDFGKRRRVRENSADGGKAEEMNRLYSVESMLTSTGAVADHRLAMRSTDVESFARALASALQAPGAPSAGPLSESAKAWLAPLVKDLQKNRGKSVVIAGPHQPASVQAAALAINAALGNIGKTVKPIKPIEAQPVEQLKELKTLVDEMNGGKVDLLLILGGNPVYNAPADIDFAGALDKVKLRLHMGLYQNETSSLCQWHVNEAHTLESWGDVRGYDGTVTIIQPLIAPLYNGHTVLEFVAALAASPDEAEQSGHELLYAYWKKTSGSDDFEPVWHRALEKGVMAKTASPAVNAALVDSWSKNSGAASAASGTTEICFRADPTIYDGRFANNGWLQELPKPISKLCWDNAAIMSIKQAAKLGIKADPQWTAGERGRMQVEYVELTYRGRKIKAAAWPQPGHADDSITVYLGHGRERAGETGNGTGFNAYKIRTSDAYWNGAEVAVRKLEDTVNMACTQAHYLMEGRKPVRLTTARVMAEMKMKVAEDDAAEIKKKQKATIEFNEAMEPVAAAAEWDLIKGNVPGPFERSEVARNRADEHDHHDHEEGHESNGHHHAHDRRMIPMTLYPPSSKEGRRWAMTIDLSSCIGCNTCMIACQAENNIPIVGKKEVSRAREMHWIRVDRYHQGDLDDPEGLKTYFQPVPCQQCEKAPCEVVCPVGATVHSTDGLNDMVYNRCVGTRYCSNNCPYKVRRFNFFSYADFVTETLKLGRNPEVTVRSRGVMEKCTYCVQRIRATEIEAEREWATRPKDDDGRPKIFDGEIVTACQAACPTEAIVFGDLSDTKSVVRRWKAEPTNYGLLAELNTMPRTSYLAAVRNPNPEMPKGGA